ncbi:hypothetical protein [Pseudomonas frederiksbergensis]|uniref:Uncharacterized protein n=1 Tax=Pseudomonas frederiksbergensis TaxID=104087 RepID=A0A423K0V1_9PSED|nr:hypothetical protein [Pseudomonas frederiksbergensis]RON44222.1 hypothetical protein BK666_17845 [Pseudomonas frederiksbergensis]
MALIYDVPRIGTHYKFGQRGPTCWYYAAKMLLKFHGLYDKADVSAESIYEQMKTLHELRRSFTETGETSNALSTAGLQANQAKMLAYQAAITRLKAKPNLSKAQKEQLATLEKAKADERLPRIDAAIELLKKQALADMGRLEILQSFIGGGYFCKINREQYLKPEDVEPLLERWGPFYTGGSVVAAVKTDTGEVVPGGDRIISVTEFKPDGSHAIVVCGADDKLVYYKDPHDSSELRTMDLKKFHAGLDTDVTDFLIAINCNMPYDPDNGGCTHMLTKRIVIAP